MISRILGKQRLDNFFLLKRGYDLPSQDRKEGAVPVISSSGRTGFHAEAKAKGPGVITGRYGTLGEVFYQEGKYWPLNTTLYVYDFKGNNPRFVYYFLKALNFEHLNSAAAVPGLDRNVLHSLKINFPAILIQNQIADILSVYDELIVNNTERINLLEEMAEEIYKEWFVRLRFPGHEQTSIVDGLPEGWDIVKIADAFEILGGGTPSTTEKEFWGNGNILWVTPSDITAAAGIFINDTPAKITELGLKGSSAKLFPAYSVMMTSRATIGEVGINLQPATTNQGFITCLPNDNFPFTYIVAYLTHNKPMIDAYASGATFKEISKSVFKKMEVIRPSLQVTEKYHQNVEPLFHAMSNYLEKNKLLKQTRDLLLPRLMSGKLRVGHLLEPDT